jgi:hypothetical protein
MKSEKTSPATHLVRYGVVTASGAFRAYLRHAWMQTGYAQDGAAVFDAALAKPETLLPLGTHPWSGVLARSLRRVARLFADESLARRFASSTPGAAIAPALNAFAPLCQAMDVELENAGFEVQLGDSDVSVREQLCPHLPDRPVVPHLGAARVWLPELFSGMMQAAMWREIVADDDTLKLASALAAEFFAEVYRAVEAAEPAPSAPSIEQAMLVFAPKAVEYGLGQLAWMMEPSAADELLIKALPYLRATFSRETPPPAILAPTVVPPPVVTLPPRSKTVAPILAKSVAPVRNIEAAAMPKPVEDAPFLRAVPKPENSKPARPVSPSVPPSGDDDDEEEDDEIATPHTAFRVVRWVVGFLGAGIVVIAALPFIGTSGIDVGPSSPEVNAAVVELQKAKEAKGPERMVVAQMEPLAEPSPVTAAPAAIPRLFEQAQGFAESARRSKRSGDNRQAAEDLSRALLIFKQEFGEQRWRDPRYLEIRTEHEMQLSLLEFSKPQINAIQEVLGARETVKAEPIQAVTPGLEKLIAAFERGNEELERGRPKAAAEAYELGLRSGMEVLKDQHLVDRTYQKHLSLYIDFLLSMELEPDELHVRLGLVKSGKKPGPLPDKRVSPETEGLGLPKLP